MGAWSAVFMCVQCRVLPQGDSVVYVLARERSVWTLTL